MNDIEQIPTYEVPRSKWVADKTDIGAALEAGGYHASVAGGDFPRLVKAAEALLHGSVRGLVIYGATGNGKSLAASILADGILTRPKTPYCAEECRPRRIECSNIPLSTKDERDALSLARGMGDWWLEDLGYEPPTNEFGVKYDPIALFFQNLSPSSRFVATTNLDAGGIRDRYGDRVLSRLLDNVGWINFKNADKRMTKAKSF